MVCKRCGRELCDEAVVCKGCGEQQKHMEVRCESLGSLLMHRVRGTEKSPRVLTMCLLSLLCVGLCLASLKVYPIIENYFVEKNKQEQYTGVTNVDAAADRIDAVSGNILSVRPVFGLPTVRDEAAYDDGTWEKDYIVSDQIVYKTFRYPLTEDWINKYLFELYPDIQTVAAVDAVPSFTDCTSSRIRIMETSYAPECVVEAVCIADGDYDHILVIEMPKTMFDEYDTLIEDMIESIAVVDASAAQV